MLQSIAYLSKSNFHPSAIELSELVAKIQAKNASMGVTGFLIYDRHRFFQYIEGQSDTLLELFETIKNDPRHTILSQSSKSIESRSFKNWSMRMLHFENLTKILPENNLIDLVVFSNAHPELFPSWEENAWEIIGQIGRLNASVA
tara:strand:- start:74 stop:508 length:435 start_codon:yes stop_codon:yes gene_type:complete